MQLGRLVSPSVPLSALVGLVGAGLALAATLGYLPPGGLAHLAGLVVLGLALWLGATAVRRETSRAHGDALLVLGAFWLHLFALVVGALAAGWWLLAGGSPALLRAAVAWGLGAAAYALLGYGVDRATETDVDEVLADWRS